MSRARPNHGAAQGFTEADLLRLAASLEREGLRVQQDYQRFLGRLASSGEVGYWVNAFAHGSTNEDIITGFVASPEYFHNSTGQ